MRYLVVSDNHGDREILVDILSKRKDEIDIFFHCGDSELAGDDELWETYHVVRGNCDFGPGFEDQQVVPTGEDTVFMTHGHLYNVRFGLTALSMKAQEAHATLAFFGHTHELGCQQDNGILYLNPGSISQPRGAIKIPTYAIIDSTELDYHVQYFNRAHQVVEELDFHFPKA